MDIDQGNAGSVGCNVIAFPTPVAPRVVLREYGYLEDESWDDSALPTYREAWNYDDSDPESQCEMLISVSYLTDSELASEFDLVRGADGWTYGQLGELEHLFLDSLEQQISPEELGPALQREYGSQRGGFAVIDALPSEDRERLGLVEIVGEQPGSSYCGVRYTGDLALLNAALRKQGANIVVRDAAGEG